MSDVAAGELAARLHAREGVAALLGITVLEVTEGAAQVSMTIRPDMTNGFMSAHGGIIFTLADCAFACACNSRGGRAVAFHCSITFVEPVEVGETLVATAREVLRKGRTGIYDVEVTSGTRTVAEFRGHSRYLEQDTQKPLADRRLRGARRSK